MLDTDRAKLMLKRACAFCLLILALSPFTAPFQTWDANDARASRKAPLELLPVFRDDSDPCILVAVRIAASAYVTIASLFDLPLTTFASSAATCLTRSAKLTTLAGDESIRTAILRL